MAWTAPMTAVAGQALTAVDWNSHVRDNLNETAPAKATTSGSIFVGNGANSIVERIPSVVRVDTQESTAVTSFTNLATVGPTITVQTGAAAFVSFHAEVAHNTAGAGVWMAVEVSGATTIAAQDKNSAGFDMVSATNNRQRSGQSGIVPLNPGLNTFTMKYRTSSGTMSARWRELTILPL